MDAMLQSAALAGIRDIEKDKELIYLPQSIGSILIGETNLGQYETLRIYAEIQKQDDDAITANIYLYAENGEVLITFNEAEFKSSKRNRGYSGAKAYVTEWVKTESSGYLPDNKKPDGILFYASENYLEDCRKLIHIVKATGDRQLNLTVVTSNAVKVLDSDKPENYIQAALWGLCRCIREEHKNIHIKLADTDDIGSFDASLLNIKNCREFALRSGETYSLKIKEAGNLESNVRNGTGTAVIIGASGGLAYRYALYLAERGIKDIALTARKKSDRTELLISVMKYYGINAKLYLAEAESHEELRKTFALIENEFPPLGSVYHLAGISKDSLVVNLDETVIEQHFASKIKIAENLYKIISEELCGNLYLFGSLVGLTGNMGQGAYAGANACLQSFSEYTGCRFIGYGALDTGMAAADSSIFDNFEKQGIGVMDTELAVLFADSIAEPRIYAADVNWSDFLKQSNLAEDIKFTGLGVNNETHEKLTDSLRLYSHEEGLNLIQDFLKMLYAKALDTEPALIDTERITNTMGINSLSSSLISNSINREFNTSYLNSHVTGDFTICDFAKKIYAEVTSGD